MAVVVNYVRAVGFILAAIIVVLYALNSACNVGANLWLSDWSNDASRNQTVAMKHRDLRLGVYIGLGLAQGE